MLYELETSVSFSLPLVVGQSDLLLDLWKSTAPLESFVYRKTRFGAFTWRVGIKRIFSTSDRLVHEDDRLTIVRLLSSPQSFTSAAETNDDIKIETTIDDDSTVVAELKTSLLTDRTVHYDDNSTYETNIKYPLILEDRLSVEIPRPTANTIRDYLTTEHDTSDNNLGINHEHRLSAYLSVCRKCSHIWYISPRMSWRNSPLNYKNDDNELICSACHDGSDDNNSTTETTMSSLSSSISIVRLSLRSNLNEYHEISYRYDLECETTPMMTHCGDGVVPTVTENSIERRARHRAIFTIFHQITAPSFHQYWPLGLSRDGVPFSPPKELLDALQIMRIASGESYLTREKLFDALSSSVESGTMVIARTPGIRWVNCGWMVRDCQYPIDKKL